jgi:phenylpyruvate tautomerase PptA (4-oxalocrotonate tautomerase family)
MPLVRIDAMGANRDRLEALGRAVHDAMVEAINVPSDDVFQILTGHDGASSTLRYAPDYVGVHHDDGIVFVSITLLAGRTPAQKQALYQRIAELAQERTGTAPRNVIITLTENERIDWSFGDGVAQYAPPAG